MKDNYDLSPLKRKKKVNSRAKGNKFENDICKILNERFNTTDFMRAPGSGAFATTHSLPDHLKFYGDLLTPQNFAFTIECKKGYNTLDLTSILNYKSKIWEFIKQAERDAGLANKKPLLIFKQDRKDAIYISRAEDKGFPEKKVTFYSDGGIIYELGKLDELLTLPNHIFLT